MTNPTHSTVDRTAIVADVRKALWAELRRTLPPSIDPMRSVTFDRAADRAVLVVERALGHPLRKPCGDCDGKGCRPCDCWDGCPSTYQCPTCEGEGAVLDV